MRVNDALWRSGGSAGIDNVERVGRGRRHGCERSALLCHPIGQRRMIAHGVAYHNDFDIAQCDAFEVSQLGRIHEQMHCPGVLQHRRQLCWRCRRGQGRSAAPSPNCREIYQCILNIAGPQYRNGLPRLEIIALKLCGNARRQLRNFAPSQLG